jgi:hypothetical protein
LRQSCWGQHNRNKKKNNNNKKTIAWKGKGKGSANGCSCGFLNLASRRETWTVTASTKSPLDEWKKPPTTIYWLVRLWI